MLPIPTLLIIVLALSGAPAEGQRPAIDYSKFSHSTHVAKGKLACDSCHKFPTKNWREVRKGDAAFPDVTEFPEHASCLNCHRQQFFARERPAPRICSNCHVRVTPIETSRYSFPTLGKIPDFVSDFRVVVPPHEEQPSPLNHATCFTCHNQESELPPLPQNCDACHKPAK